MSTLAVGTLFFCLVASPGAVYDADTWTCHGGAKVRLRGADAFEIARPKEPGGIEARNFMRSLIAGKQLTCWVVQREPSHDRVVAACSHPGIGDLSQALVAAGHARACKAFGGDALNQLEPRPLTGPGWCEGKS